MIRDKGVFSKKTPVLIKNNTSLGRIAIFLYLFIEESAKPQGHAQK